VVDYEESPYPAPDNWSSLDMIWHDIWQFWLLQRPLKQGVISAPCMKFAGLEHVILTLVLVIEPEGLTLIITKHAIGYGPEPVPSTC